MEFSGNVYETVVTLAGAAAKFISG